MSDLERDQDLCDLLRDEDLIEFDHIFQELQQEVSHQNVFDHPQPGSGQQQFLDMSNNNIPPSSGLVRSNQNRNSENKVLPSVGDQNLNHELRLQKSKTRHTLDQTRRLQEFFKRTSQHPNPIQRKQLSRELNMTTEQIKHWFQNKRTQVKTLKERRYYHRVKRENEILRAENEYYKEELKRTTCSKCGDPIFICDKQLIIDNARLKAKIPLLLRRSTNGENLAGSNSNIDQMTRPALVGIEPLSTHTTPTSVGIEHSNTEQMTRTASVGIEPLSTHITPALVEIETLSTHTTHASERIEHLNTEQMVTAASVGIEPLSTHTTHASVGIEHLNTEQMITAASIGIEPLSTHTTHASVGIEHLNTEQMATAASVGIEPLSTHTTHASVGIEHSNTEQMATAALVGIEPLSTHTTHASSVGIEHSNTEQMATAHSNTEQMATNASIGIEPLSTHTTHASVGIEHSNTEQMATVASVGIEPLSTHTTHASVGIEHSNTEQMATAASVGIEPLSTHTTPASVSIPTGSILTDVNKQKIVELAVVSMEELTKLTLAGSPLWISSDGSEILNKDEYIRVFPNILGPQRMGTKSESSRQSVLVFMNHIKIVEMLMNVDQWSTIFSCIVSNAMTLQVLLPSVSGNYNGAMQVMSANFQIPSPFVAARENYFVRYCKQYQQGVWAVVDVSLDHLLPTSSTTLRSQRRPSGCLIQELPNGYSKITWVEHVEVYDDTMLSNGFYNSLISSGLAFGAIRWVTSLDRQCERLSCSLATEMPAGDFCGKIGVEGRKNLLNLAETMKACFFTVVGTSLASCWKPKVLTYDFGDVRVMTKTNMGEHGTPLSMVVNVGTSLYLPVPPRKLFNFLRNQKSRTEWDILSIGSIVKETAHIAHGHDLDNCISLFYVKSENWSQKNMFVLQDNNIDNTSCSHVIYAPIDYDSMKLILNGDDPNTLNLLPSGFVILPYGFGSSLLTISFQVLFGASPSRRLVPDAKIKEVVSLVKNTIKQIKVACAGL